MDEKIYRRYRGGPFSFRDVSFNPYSELNYAARKIWAEGYYAACEDFKKFAVWTQDLE